MADSKISDLPAHTSPDGEDLLVVVDDPGGIPTTKSITIAQLQLYVSTSTLNLSERNSDPGNPAEGNSVIWQSDGTGSGDDGDIMIKITAGGSTKVATIIDFSELP
jgi:hypothetical protein